MNNEKPKLKVTYEDEIITTTPKKEIVDPRDKDGGAINEKDKPTVERLTFLEKVANEADAIIKNYFCFTIKGDWWYFKYDPKKDLLPEWINLSEIYSEAKLNGVLAGHYLRLGGKRLDSDTKDRKENDSEIVKRVFFDHSLDPKRINYRTVKACFLNYWLDENFEKQEYHNGRIYMPNMIPYDLLDEKNAWSKIERKDQVLITEYFEWSFSHQKVDEEENIDQASNPNIDDIFNEAEKAIDKEIKYEFNLARYNCVFNYWMCSILNHNFAAFYLFGSDMPRTGKTTFSYTIPMNISPNGIKPIPKIALTGSQNAKFDLTGFDGYTLGVCQELGNKISEETIENLKAKHETTTEYMESEDKNKNQSKRYNIGKFAATTQHINAEWKNIDEAIKSRFIFVHLNPDPSQGHRFADKKINKLLRKKNIIEWIIAKSYEIFIDNWKNNDEGSRADMMRFGCEDTNWYFANVSQREEFLTEEFKFENCRVWKKYRNVGIGEEIKIWNAEFKDDYDDYKYGDLDYIGNSDNKKPKYQVSKQTFLNRFFFFLKLNGFEKTKINSNYGWNSIKKEYDRFNIFIKKIQK